LVSADVELCRYCTRRALPFDSALSAFRYAAPIDQAVQRLKYSADFLAARWLGDAMAAAARSRAPALPDLLLPVPLHRGRLLRRGYNQAQELARVIGRELGIANRPRLARRVRATADQIGQSAHDRRRNLRGAFAVDAAVRGKRVALIDDVMTTGSTLAELARACRAAGAIEVQAWTVARVE
jgi:ComF family protein